MMIIWVKRLAIPLLAVGALSACQGPYYQRGYAQPTYAAAPTCDSYQYAPPKHCYQRERYRRPSYERPARRPVEYVRRPAQSDCVESYRPARSAYRQARAPRDCAPIYRQPRGYRYVGERPPAPCGPTYDRRYRSAYNEYRPARYREPRRSYRRSRDTSCCY